MYAEKIYPLVIQAANRKIELTIIEEGDTAKADKLNKNKHSYASYKLDLKVDGVKNLVLNTDHLAQKIEATNLIVQMSEDMKQAFAPLIEQTLPTIKELISYKHNKEIRNNMIETVKYMIIDCSTPEQKALVVRETFQPICDELAQTIKTKDNGEASCIVEVMAEMMPFMTQEMAAKMPAMLTAVLTLIKNETAEVEKEYADKEMDEALQEEMGDEISEIEEVLNFLFLGIGTHREHH